MRFQIPNFQRPYEWNEGNCQVLLDDIELLRSQLPDPKPHFLGTLVTQPHVSANLMVVIDGQQRLTTMYLLFLALSRVAHERAHDDQEGARYQELEHALNKILKDNRDSQRHPFTLTGEDKLALSKLFEGESGLDDNSKLTINSCSHN